MHTCPFTFLYGEECEGHGTWPVSNYLISENTFYLVPVYLEIDINKKSGHRGDKRRFLRLKQVGCTAQDDDKRQDTGKIQMKLKQFKNKLGRGVGKAYDNCGCIYLKRPKPNKKTYDEGTEEMTAESFEM